MSAAPVLLMLLVILRFAGGAYAARPGAAARSGGGKRDQAALLVPSLASGDVTRAVVLGFGTATMGCVDAAWWAWAGFGVLLATVLLPSVSVPLAARWLPVPLVHFLGALVAPHASRGAEAGWITTAVLAGGRPLSESDVARLRRRLRQLPIAVPYTVLGEAALAEATGDDLRARRLMFALADLGAFPGITAPRRRARQWCMARAAVRGDWERVTTLEVAPWSGRAENLVARTLRGVATGRRPSRLELLEVAVRLRSLALVRLAWGLPRGEWEPWVAPTPPPGTPPLEAALWHNRQLGFQWPTQAAVEAMAAAWDPLPRDAALREALTERAAVVGFRVPADPPGPDGAPPPEPPPAGLVVLRSLWGLVVGSAAQLYAQVHFVPRGEGETTSAIREVVREKLYRELEDALAGIAEGARRPPQEDPAGLWALWQQVRDPVDALAGSGGQVERGMAFDAAFTPVLDWAVWLHNVAGQKPLAHLVMRWLVEVGDGAAPEQEIDLLRRNLAIGY